MSETKNLVDKINELHTEFKAAIERNDSAATERLNTAIDAVESKLKEIEKAANRPETKTEVDEREIKNFRDMLTGRINAAEYKTMSGGSSTDGGYTIPKVIDNAIRTAVVDISPIRSVARVISVPTTDFHIPFSPAGAASGWVGETDTRPATGTPQFADVKPTFGEVYANPQITQQLLDDSQFDLSAFLAQSVSVEFARQEGYAFINGNGTNKPTGFLNGTIVATADSSRAFGSLQYIAGGSASVLPTTFDPFITMVHSLKQAYRNGACWLVSKAVLGSLRTIKDSTGQYLWQPSVVAGVPSTMLGYQVIECEDMPVVGAGAYPVAFGNWDQGYVIADRIGTRTITDYITNKPYVGLYTTKRVGGCVVDSAAIKLLKIAAS